MESTTQQLSSIQAKLTSQQQQNTQQLQKLLLADLYNLRQTFLQQLQTLSLNPPNPQNTTAPTFPPKEDPKDLEIQELKAQNARLQYRISHLVKNLRERL